MISPISQAVKIDVSCNSDCTKCCPRKLKFFFLCWCCKCGCDDLVEEKVKEVADKIIKEASLSQASRPTSPDGIKSYKRSFAIENASIESHNED